MTTNVTEKNADGSQSLRRGMLLIEFLSDYPNGCPLAKIADATGLNKSTAHRLLKSLHDMGYVTPTSTPGSYRLTSKFIAVGHKTLSALNIINIAAPRLEKINLDTGDTINLATREGNHCVLVYKLEPTTGMLRTRSYIGQRTPLYCSGMGKAFLAFSSDSYLDKYWKEENDSIVRFTSNTIVDIKVMRFELARIREELISFDREENEIGTGCIAAPIFGPQRRNEYAISISLPMSRLDDKRRMELAEIIKTTAATISREIGGDI